MPDSTLTVLPPVVYPFEMAELMPYPARPLPSMPRPVPMDWPSGVSCPPAGTKADGLLPMMAEELDRPMLCPKLLPASLANPAVMLLETPVVSAE